MSKSRNIFVVGFAGKNGKKVSSVCDISFCGPSNNTVHIQEAHITIGRIIYGLVEKNIKL